MIPRRFFWFFDLLILGVAFLVAYLLVPRLAPLFALGGSLRTLWLETLVSPAIWSGQIPPLPDDIFARSTCPTALGASGRSWRPLRCWFWVRWGITGRCSINRALALCSAAFQHCWPAGRVQCTSRDLCLAIVV
jgi:hypothetical protein